MSRKRTRTRPGMERRPFRRSRWAVAWLVIMSAVLQLAGQFAAAVPTNLTVLIILPLSDTVLGSVYSKWVDIINVARPVMSTIDPYHNYDIIFRDSAGSRSKAVSVLMNVTQQQPVRALVGEYSSRITLGLALAANTQNLWHCSLAASNDFDSLSDFPVMFRPAPNNNVQGPALARFVAGMNWRSVSILSVADTFGQSMLTTFGTAASPLGISTETVQQFLPGTTDFTPLLSAIKASGSKVVIVFGYAGDYKLFLRQAKLMGMVGPEWAWIGTSSLLNYLDVLTLESDRELANGLLFVTFREDHTLAEYQTLRSNYLATFPSRDAEKDLSGVGLLYYDCMLALAYGFRRMTDIYGDSAVQTHSYPATVTDFAAPFSGVIGPVTYSSVLSRNTPVWQVMNIYGNTLRLCYVVYENSTVQKVTNPIFNGGSTKIPLDRPPLVLAYPQWTDPGVQALAAIRALMIVLMLFGMGYLVLHRFDKQIKQLSLPFLLVISVGCILILVSEYILIGVPAAPACHSSSVVLTIGYELVFASALVKTYRIYRIFDNTRINKGGVKSKDLFRKIAIIIAVQVVLFIIWIAAFPVSPTLVTTKLSLYYECRPTNFAGHWGVLGISFVYNFVLLFLVCYFAYKTRNVDSGYRETAWIMYTAQNVCLCSIIIIALSLFTIESIALTAYYIRSIVMLYAVGFTFMALVGRLVVAVAADHRHAAPTTSPKELISSPLGTALESKGIKAPAVAGGDSPNVPRKSVSSGAVGAPGSELNGVYPVLRRGGGLSLLAQFMTTWRSTHVYINFARGVVAVLPPSPTAGGATGRGRAGSARAAAAAAANAAANASSARKMGDVFPLSALGFDTSPAGAPAGCIELVHVPTGAAWVVQLSTEEVAIWTQALKAVAVVVTTAGGGSPSGGRSSSSGGGGQPGSAPGSAVGASGTTVVGNANGGGSAEGQGLQPARSRSPSAVRQLEPGAGGVDC
ncbi:Gamma-aminobutyric acid type B receptor subunit 2 [Allomyces javanicus]|nr:Gamma-aminobutyric acid type B receptor subunit 2 [Allomyces javanicus]